jgi:hypothetical protein
MEGVQQSGFGSLLTAVRSVGASSSPNSSTRPSSERSLRNENRTLGSENDRLKEENRTLRSENQQLRTDNRQLEQTVELGEASRRDNYQAEPAEQPSGSRGETTSAAPNEVKSGELLSARGGGRNRSSGAAASSGGTVIDPVPATLSGYREVMIAGRETLGRSLNLYA